MDKLILLLYFILGGYLLFYCTYFMSTLVIGSFYKTKYDQHLTNKHDNWLIIIPAYNPNSILLKVLESIYKFSPKNDYQVFVLFQNADQKIIDKSIANYTFEHDEKSFDPKLGNTYVQALKYINSSIKNKEDFTHVILLDKDNIVDENFFSILATIRANGFEYIQGKRLPLALKNGVASYDAISEELNNVTLRNYKAALNWMPELTGSAFIIKQNLFYNGIENLDLKNPGMDKNLFLEWLLNSKENIKSTYTDKALVYEEKTDDIKVLKQQRTRWFAEQYLTAFAYSKKLISRFIKTGRLEILDYTISIFRPPRSVVYLILPLFFILERIFIPQYYLFTLSTLFLCIGTVLFLIKRKLVKVFLSFIFSAPKIIISNIRSLSNIFNKKISGIFIHTERNS
ncbi:glycosyltransferase [Flammeovirga kamogawensis]|uniref:Glycosyltransferase family 2 protein n=1 Tax=Flammeovirga kamogawensis TaxID=373891 RepID=A0ABX8H2H5_9BACT|nr:glycosyltransferase [Flammeovirga kamogawensis]MBB6460219.1 cellulose synthase/poly-beta-1,6-N-acetylglucosamine synthase-like glycosyltransferase [Flammeovirga kamogawensis]QWG10031.1 glycosyltransferase family 2 protein [Flammeovirga kamogawensis]TRX65539.1 glycosyltransferase family 2 protein [Flammeovirga kamogawensis]